MTGDDSYAGSTVYERCRSMSPGLAVPLLLLVQISLGFSPSTFKAGGLSSSASLLVGHCSPRARYRTQQHQQQQQQQQRQHNRHQHGRRCHGVPKACRRTSTFMRMHGAGRGEGVVKQAFGGDDEGDANTMKRHAVRGGRRRSRMYITSSGSSSTSSSTTAEGGLETGDPARSHDGVAEEPETTPLVQRERRINVVLTHTTADFDSLAAAVGLAKLWQHELPDDECCVCMPRGMHPVVKRFMALHKNLFPIKALKDIDKDKVFRVGLVDAQRLDRIGAADSLLANATEVHVVDHHVGQDSDINATTILIEKVGSVSTIITEQLQHQELNVEAAEATLLALGVHADTGSLTFDSATSRDAASLAWLMEQGASQQAVAEYGHAALSPEQQSTLTECINNLNRTSLNGTTVSTALLRLDSYVSGMAAVAQNVLDVTDTDVFVLGAFFPQRRGRDPTHMVVIGRARSRMNPVNLDALMSAFGGGGHPKAAAASFRLDAHTIEGNRASPEEVMQELVDRIFMEQVKEAEVAEDIMTAPVQTCEPRQTMREVARILARHDIRGMPVVNEMGEVLGLISRREVEKVTKQGREDELVKGWMAHQFAMADVRDPLHEVEDLFIKEDVGRLPVVRDGKLVGLITRADMLRQHQFYDDLHYHNRAFATPVDSPMRKLLANLRKRLKKYDDD